MYNTLKMADILTNSGYFECSIGQRAFLISDPKTETYSTSLSFVKLSSDLFVGLLFLCSSRVMFFLSCLIHSSVPFFYVFIFKHLSGE